MRKSEKRRGRERREVEQRGDVRERERERDVMECIRDSGGRERGMARERGSYVSEEGK